MITTVILTIITIALALALFANPEEPHQKKAKPRLKPKAPSLLRYPDANWQRGQTALSGLPREQLMGLCGAKSRYPAQTRLDMSLHSVETYLESFVEREAQRMSSRGSRRARGGNNGGIDLRTLGFTSPVQDQGSCGSCVAFGCTATANATIKVGEEDPDLPIQLSPADLFFCEAAKEGFGCDTGWYLDHGLAAMSKGIVSEEDYPYNVADQRCPIAPGALASVTGFKPIESIEEAQKWLEEEGAILASMLVFADFIDYQGGLYVPLQDDPDSDFLGFHCISIVGYVEGAWLAQNSWGEDWGEEGFFWIPFGRCGIDSELYGITGYELFLEQEEKYASNTGRQRQSHSYRRRRHVHRYSA